MTHPLNPAMAATEPPPVMEARRWLAGATFTPARPLLNVSQAAPVDSPPLALRQALAEAAGVRELLDQLDRLLQRAGELGRRQARHRRGVRGIDRLHDLTDAAAFLAARGRDLSDASAEDIEAYFSNLGALGLAPATASRRRAAVRQFYRFVLGEGWRTDDPSRRVAAPRQGRGLGGLEELGTSLQTGDAGLGVRPGRPLGRGHEKSRPFRLGRRALEKEKAAFVMSSCPARAG